MNDTGPNPLVANIEHLTLHNDNYRTTVWTGKYMQLTVMNIKPGDDIGLEVHDDHDQFIRIEQGEATVTMGDSKDALQEWKAADDDMIMVPAGKWHNVINSGTEDLKVYSLYSPPEHAHGAVHKTKAQADADEHEY